MFKRSGVNIHQEKTCFAFFIFWLDLIVSLPPNFSTEALDPLEASPPDFRYLPHQQLLARISFWTCYLLGLSYHALTVLKRQWRN